MSHDPASRRGAPGRRPRATWRRPSGPWALALLVWIVLAPGVLTGCSSLNADKRILQQAVQMGFGRRYQGRATEENYLLVGDLVQVTDTFNNELNFTDQVDLDGTIQVPQAGGVVVAGLTREDVAALLDRELSAYFVDVDVHVDFNPGAGRIVYVLGQVARAGPFPLQGDLTVLDAVLAAGPAAHSANMSRVKLIRTGTDPPLIATLDIAAVIHEGNTTDNWPLQEFDIVYVPPTVMQEIADFVSGILVPFTSIFRSVFQILFQIRGPRFGNQRLTVF